MKERIELLMLDAVKLHGSFMPLFTEVYGFLCSAIIKVMEWGKQLEKAGELFYSEEGTRSLTELGEQRWKLLKKGKRDFSILPLEGYRIPKLNIDDIYLP